VLSIRYVSQVPRLRSQNTFYGERVGFIAFLKQVFHLAENFERAEKFLGALPPNDPRSTDLPEIKAVIKGPCP